MHIYKIVFAQTVNSQNNLPRIFLNEYMTSRHKVFNMHAHNLAKLVFVRKRRAEKTISLSGLLFNSVYRIG